MRGNIKPGLIIGAVNEMYGELPEELNMKASWL